ncbi:hypothetical protein KCP69_17795 [Salmonella enterica subsp. enterica]|nr:hypothetical protein KCP69_17795 [Salmonella enterica subsp. enterica]
MCAAKQLNNSLLLILSPDDIADFRRKSKPQPLSSGGAQNALTDAEIARFAVNQFHFNGVTIDQQ